MSNIPSSAGSSPGDTKNLHLGSLSLYPSLTVNTPNCLILGWFYVFDMTELFFVGHKATSVDLGNKILKTMNCFR